MKTILSIQSHVTYGYVGNRAATFPLQLLGHEVITINTVQFSNHTGYGDWTGQIFTPDHIGDLLAGLEKRGCLENIDGILSGYLGDAALGGIVLKAVADIRRHKPDVWYCCDPVMGDTGRGLFVRENIPSFFRNEALPAARILTPNQYEAALLSGREITTRADAIEACRALHAHGPEIILLTSLETVETPDGQIQMMATHKDGRVWIVTTPKLPLTPAPNGAGDLTAALFLGRMLETQDTAEALSLTASSVYGVFQATKEKGQRELALIPAQAQIKNPSVRFTAEVLA